ncbi:MAG: hypothetical protein AAF213_09850 [Pseudomonadota bacterium]
MEAPLIRAVIYMPHYDHQPLAKAMIDRAGSINARYSHDQRELEAAIREHDCHVLMIFAPRRMADLGQILTQVAPYLLRWQLAISVVGAAPTLDQAHRLRRAAVTDYSILPLGGKTLGRRLRRAVALKQEMEHWEKSWDNSWDDKPGQPPLSLAA